MDKTYNWKGVFRCAGGFMAWVIGSGFATGQEVLQFFTSYGYESFLIVLVNLAGFLLVGTAILTTGYEKRDEENFEQLQYYCGRRLGTFYSWMIPVTLVPSMSVLISGAGATLNEYYGLNHYVGAALMAGAVLVTYFIGFNRLVKVLSFIGPSIIAFCLLVGVVTVVRDFGSMGDVPDFEEALAVKRSAPNWVISAILYVSYNFLCGSVYYTQLGKTAGSLNEARLGAVIGALALIAAITVISTAILLNGGEAAALDIPNLYLAKKISWMLGAVFSIFLVLGIFSSCSAMMWIVCQKFSLKDPEKDRWIAVGIAAGTFLMGLLSFGDLIATLYPFIGYCGLVYMIGVMRKKFKRQNTDAS